MSRVSVVIVDDDAPVRVSLQRFCQVSELSATAYASGRELLASLDGGASLPDCLLLDAHMPEMNGFELQRHLIARGVHIPTIIITADETPEVFAHYATGGVAGYLRKPIAGDDLLTAIEQAVRGRPP